MKGSFKTKSIDIGTLKVGKKTTVIFKVIGKLPPIHSITSSCGCTKPEYDEYKGEVKVIYKPKNIPQHLKSQGWYKTTKTVTITYIDGMKDILSLTSIVKK